MDTSFSGVARRYQLEPYATQAEPYYAAKDPAHDFVHIRRILERLELLRDGEELRLDLLYFLACYHGLARQLDHSGFREDTASSLDALGWEPDEISQAFACLKRHLEDPELIEEQLVHDANYLESVGAFGIAKAFTTGGARGQHYEETIERARFFINRPVFRTAAGKRVAAERRAYAHAFLDALEAELGPNAVRPS
ncbi:HD domain-containing protein [Kitasatospora sp. NPDC001175]|uniref:hypothetical protein n=1 Tax=Kitasatospora sp. NPDC001175 TaxID=3157103 RepID=UPI003D034714